MLVRVEHFLNVLKIVSGNTISLVYVKTASHIGKLFLLYFPILLQNLFLFQYKCAIYGEAFAG